MLALLEHAQNAGVTGVVRDPGGANIEHPVTVEGPGVDRVSGALHGRHRLAREHRFVHSGYPDFDLSIARHMLARPNTHQGPHRDRSGRDSMLVVAMND